jgi:hypothetical protein
MCCCQQTEPASVLHFGLVSGISAVLCCFFATLIGANCLSRISGSILSSIRGGFLKFRSSDHKRDRDLYAIESRGSAFLRRLAAEIESGNSDPKLSLLERSEVVREEL